MRREVIGAVVLALAAAAACGHPDGEVGVVAFPAPQALVTCPAQPAGLSAELWVSGSQESCPLTVAGDGSVSGECTVTARAERTLTLDWYAMRGAGGDVRVVLAQARRTVDLTAPTSEEMALDLTADDIVVRDCVDVTGPDKVAGVTEVEVGGVLVPVCDLDDSCAGSSGTDDGCTNLGEECAGTDPLTP